MFEIVIAGIKPSILALTIKVIIALFINIAIKIR